MAQCQARIPRYSYLSPTVPQSRDLAHNKTTHQGSPQPSAQGEHSPPGPVRVWALNSGVPYDFSLCPAGLRIPGCAVMGARHPQLLDLDQLPQGQLNANLPDAFVMRVGIPHRGGSLAFHAFNEGYPAMVSANAFWLPAKGKFIVPAASNLYELDFALDSAGFTAMNLWKHKGRQDGMAGVFPWSYAQYVELASSVGAAWWSQPDLCCEPEIATSEDEIDFRIRATATLLEGTMRVVYAWQNELAKTCSANVVANLIQPPVPIIQGWSVDHYLRSLDLLQAVWRRWEPWVASPALIGVGSVCRRNLADPDHGLRAILGALEMHRPVGARFHLFGVKGAGLPDLLALPWVASADSMAFDFAARVRAHRAGHANTMAHRTAEMSHWMRSAAQRIACAAATGRFTLEVQ